MKAMRSTASLVGAPVISEQPQTYRSRIADYAVILKPRVMSLVVFTALVGLLLAPGGIDPWTGIIAVGCIAIGAGASGAINMWYDSDIDRLMARTMNRPIPADRMNPAEALVFGSVLATGSVAVMAMTVNFAAAAMLAVTILYYVFIYTMWLKRRTPQNIVIGGAAGAFPPMIGWAAVTGGIDAHSLALFAIIFLWTPPHSWALALFTNPDYARAGVPMMPVVAGEPQTRRLIILYSVLLVASSFAPVALGMAGLPYGLSALILGTLFLLRAWRLWREESRTAARGLFGFSILYLFLIFATLLADRVVLGFL